MATFQLEIKFPARRGCSVTRRRRNEISAKSPSQKPLQQPESQTRVLIKPLKPPRLLPLKQWIFSKPHMGPGKFIRALNFNYFPLSPPPPPSLLRSAPPQPKLPILRNSTFLPSADPVLGSHKIYCVLCSSAPPLIMFVVFG